ncbi:hypothetical protein CSC81_01110 [Tenacibaculum discolor]|uniref:Methionyl-tRNA formyltransferase n=1 Tax=Tenacibaculum discolor TaxID=361581 RepID=A0A2G1BYY8_9FLAO|nr:methionyl-tRNA formyltransferase [Tenacibaculum discolor]MDP2541102.1 methionyl-tRNA formyltransferase [Tenacibaculum discolor]PHN98815.1 hypothetical protein CSC81_01110 [Tenacibaculum discolor]PHO01198.1 hypothetical protein CSC82_24840 [Rhodobacteraceae bacterium 4F10]
MLSLGILCSGGLGLSLLKHALENYNVQFVLTDKKSIEICDLAREKNIPFLAGNPRKGKGYEFVKNYQVDVIASINYLFLIEEDIINHSKSVTFNIHGSLLPKYRGRTPHVWSIINGEKQTGITAHLIDPNCDTGNIIFQEIVDIESEDTGADILKKYNELYIPLFDRVIKSIINKSLVTFPQDESKASYFGKRTPDDGGINWKWMKEDIRNWVRAQAFPYPGAFTFLDSQKIIIDKVSTKSINVVGEIGSIVSVEPKVTIKVADGVVVLEQIRTKNHKFEIGKKFENENR